MYYTIYAEWKFQVSDNLVHGWLAFSTIVPGSRTEIIVDVSLFEPSTIIDLPNHEISEARRLIRDIRYP